jgi:hypothetical protein
MASGTALRVKNGYQKAITSFLKRVTGIFKRISKGLLTVFTIRQPKVVKTISAH